MVGFSPDPNSTYLVYLYLFTIVFLSLGLKAERGKVLQSNNNKTTCQFYRMKTVPSVSVVHDTNTTHPPSTAHRLFSISRWSGQARERATFHYEQPELQLQETQTETVLSGVSGQIQKLGQSYTLYFSQDKENIRWVPSCFSRPEQEQGPQLQLFSTVSEPETEEREEEQESVSGRWEVITEEKRTEEKKSVGRNWIYWKISSQ